MKLRLKKLNEQVIVITGATSGIGLVTARMAVARGARVVLAARNEEALRRVVDEIASVTGSLADRRIGRPLGTFDKPRPDLAEAHASARSVRNIALSLAALRDLAAKLSPNSPKTLAAFDHAIELAEDLDPDIDRITDPQAWLKLEILQQSVRTTRDTVIAELGPALGVELGFNSADGD